MRRSARLCNIERPAPVKCHILINRPNISLGNTLSELLFHFHFFAVFGVFDTADAHYRLNVRCIFVNDLREMNEEVSNLLVCCSLVEREPVACRFVIDSEEHSAKCTEILRNSNELFIGNVRVNGECEVYVLTVAANVTHICERLARSVALKTALVCEIVIVRIVPLECYVCILHNFGNSSREFLIERIIAIHKRNSSVRSAELVDDIILIYIFSSFRTVADVNCVLCCAQMNAVNFVCHILPSTSFQQPENVFNFIIYMIQHF